MDPDYHHNHHNDQYDNAPADNDDLHEHYNDSCPNHDLHNHDHNHYGTAFSDDDCNDYFACSHNNDDDDDNDGSPDNDHDDHDDHGGPAIHDNLDHDDSGPYDDDAASYYVHLNIVDNLDDDYYDFDNDLAASHDLAADHYSAAHNVPKPVYDVHNLDDH